MPGPSLPVGRMIGTIVRNGQRWWVTCMSRNPIVSAEIALRYERDGKTLIDKLRSNDILTIRNEDGQPIGRGYLVGGELVCEWDADERIELFS